MLDIAKIRNDFPILSQKVYGRPLVYLDNAATTQKPRAVLDRIVEFYTSHNGNIHRGVHFLSEYASSLYEAARAKVRSFINASDPAEIVFTRSATESVNLVAASFGEAFVGEGDEIIVTEMEHHSNIVPWQNLCRRKGAALKFVPFHDDGSLNMDRLRSLISDRTKLVSAVYVSNVLGQVNPAKEIVSLAHGFDIPVLIDGAQAVQHISVDVQELDCDFFVFSGHKMYADTGIGVLYGKKIWLEAMPPYQSGGGMIKSVEMDETVFGEPPLKFEAGTPHISGAASLEAAIDYIREIGLDRIEAHESDLIRYAVKRLQSIDGLAIYGRTSRPCGAVSFNLDGVHPYDAGVILDKMGIAVRTGNHCAQPVMKHYGIPGTIRASFAVYNTRDDIDQLIDGLEKARKILGD